MYGKLNRMIQTMQGLNNRMMQVLSTISLEQQKMNMLMRSMMERLELSKMERNKMDPWVRNNLAQEKLNIQMRQRMNTQMVRALNTMERQELNKLVNKPGQQERSILAPSALNSWTVNCKRPEWHTPATEFL